MLPTFGANVQFRSEAKWPSDDIGGDSQRDVTPSGFERFFELFVEEAIHGVKGETEAPIPPTPSCGKTAQIDGVHTIPQWMIQGLPEIRNGSRVEEKELAGRQVRIRYPLVRALGLQGPSQPVEIFRPHEGRGSARVHPMGDHLVRCWSTGAHGRIFRLLGAMKTLNRHLLSVYAKACIVV